MFYVVFFEMECDLFWVREERIVSNILFLELRLLIFFFLKVILIFNFFSLWIYLI